MWTTHPKTLGRAVLGELEADEAVDEQAPEDARAQPDVDGREDRVDGRIGGDDGRVEEDGEHLRDGVQVEEEYDLLAP
jgi:hypothetical protein